MATHTGREFIATFGGVVVALPLAARAQYPERMRLIGVLMPYAESDPGRATNLPLWMLRH